MGWLHTVMRRSGFVPAAVAAEQAAQQAGAQVRSARIEERRAAQLAQRTLASALTEHFTSQWQTSTGHINTDMVSGLAVCRSRSRDAAQNNEHARRFIGMCRTNILGPNGVRFQSRVKLRNGSAHEVANEAIEASFRLWSKRGNCDVTGRYSWLDMQRLTVQHLAVDGEALLRRVRGRGPHKFQLQLLDPALLDISYRRDLPGGNRIRQGVEMTGEGRVLAYHLLAQASGETDLYSTYGNYVRVPAEDIRNIFLPAQINQYRGVPWMQPVLKRLYMTADFAQSGLNKARESAKRAGFFFSPDGAAPNLADTSGTAPDGQPLSTVQDGQYDTLPEGYQFVDHKSDWPNVEYGQMVKDCVRHIATGLDLSYPTFGNDLSEVNYSSARVGVLDEREMWKLMQVFLIEQLHEWVGENWLPYAMLADPGLASLNYDRLPMYVAAQSWSPRRWNWVDPLKEIEAAGRAIELGLTSPQQVIRDRGDDPDEVLDELQQWQLNTADLFPVNGTGQPQPNLDPNAAATQASQAEGEAAKSASRRLRLIAASRNHE